MKYMKYAVIVVIGATSLMFTKTGLAMLFVLALFNEYGYMITRQAITNSWKLPIKQHIADSCGTTTATFDRWVRKWLVTQLVFLLAIFAGLFTMGLLAISDQQLNGWQLYVAALTISAIVLRCVLAPSKQYVVLYAGTLAARAVYNITQIDIMLQDSEIQLDERSKQQISAMRSDAVNVLDAMTRLLTTVR
jgi:hypothetical protein